MWRTRSLFRISRRSIFGRASRPTETGKPNYYEMLGVDKDATDQQVKMAYFKLAKTHHPDVASDDKTSEFDFEQINEAYQTLKSSQSRKIYDRTGLSSHEQKQGGVGSNFKEDFAKSMEDMGKRHLEEFEKYLKIFRYEMSNINSFFDSKPTAVTTEGEPLMISFDHTGNIVVNIQVSFTELEGAMKREDYKEQFLTKRIRFTQLDLWHDCEGEFRPKDQPETYWEVCQGKGEVVGNTGEKVDIFQCVVCKGTGKVIENPCRTWNTTGFVKKDHKLSVKVPAGMRNGEYMRIQGMGNILSGGGYGDLFVKVNISGIPQHFEIRGYDIISTHKIPVGKAVLGGEEYFDTIYGVVSSKLPPKVEPNQRFEIKGYGLPVPNSGGKKGKHIFNIEYEMP